MDSRKPIRASGVYKPFLHLMQIAIWGRQFTIFITSSKDRKTKCDYLLIGTSYQYTSKPTRKGF